MNLLCLIFLFLIINSVLSVNNKDWLAYKISFQLGFKDIYENKAYEDTWITNLALIRKHNERYFSNNQTYSMAINQFSHFDHEEFISLYTGYRRQSSLKNKTRETNRRNILNDLLPEKKSVPESIDWSTNSNVVGPMKNQGSCG